jgi:hypothetical protein
VAGNRRLVVEIFGDAKSLARAFGSTDSHLGRLSRSIGGIAKTAGFAMAGLAGGAIVAAPRILELGTELDTLGKKAETVFSGGALAEVQAWAEESAAAMGLTSDQAVGMAAGMGDLLKPMGFTADQAGEMSTEMLDLSGALSAWSGGARSASEVGDILTKALLGEREQLKELGISISEADVSQRLMEMGAEDLTGAALEQAKAIATQQLIMEKSTDAQEAWQNGTMDGVKAQNEARASIENVKEGLVKALFPALQAAVPYVASASQWLGKNMPAAMEVARSFIQDKLIPAFQTHLLPIIEKVVAWVEENWPQISATVIEVMRRVREVVATVLRLVQALWDRFGHHLIALVQRIFPPIIQVIKGALDIITGIIRTVTAIINGDWEEAWEGIKQIVAGAWEAIQGIVDIGINLVRSIIEIGWGLIKSVWNTALDALEAAWDATFGRLLGPIQSAIDKVQTLIDKVNAAANAIASLNPLATEGADASDPDAGSGSWSSDSGGRSSRGFKSIRPIGARSASGPMVFPLIVDGRELARATVPYLPGETRRRGGVALRTRG